MDKCININCPLKSNCYRPSIPYNSKTKEVYFEFKIIGKDKNHIECDGYWKNTHEPTKQIRYDR